MDNKSNGVKTPKSANGGNNTVQGNKKATSTKQAEKTDSQNRLKITEDGVWRLLHHEVVASAMCGSLKEFNQLSAVIAKGYNAMTDEMRTYLCFLEEQMRTLHSIAKIRGPFNSWLVTEPTKEGLWDIIHSELTAASHFGVQDTFNDLSTIIKNSSNLVNDDMLAHIHYLKGFMFDNSFRNFGEALAEYNEAVRLNPREGVYFYDRGTVKGKMGDLKGKKSDFKKGLAIRPELEDLFTEESK